jgi:hypothetical protein
MHSDWMQLSLSATFSDHEYPARRGAGVDRNPWLAKLNNSSIQFARMQFPFQDVISTMDEVPSEHHFFTPQTNDVLVGFIHRYHH